jgi:NitT/TauT family transport system substrate-binding protein
MVSSGWFIAAASPHGVAGASQHRYAAVNREEDIMKIRCAGWLLVMVVGWLPAVAQPLRVGKSAPTVYSYALLEAGIAQGIFARHGVELTSTAFGGSGQLLQAMTAGALDIALDTGPDMAMVAKGVPMKAVAPLAGPPLELVIVARDGGAVHSIADLHGQRLTVSGLQTMTGWLARELSRTEGWGKDGIILQPVPSPVTAVAMLRAGQIDAVTVDLTSGLKVEQGGFGHILVRHGDRVRHFHMQVIFASDRMIAEQPDKLRGFLAGWFETVAWARGHKAEMVAVAQRVLDVDPALLGQIHDTLAPNWSDDGKFDSQALEVLRGSFVELGMLSQAPDMATLIDTRFIP